MQGRFVKIVLLLIAGWAIAPAFSASWTISGLKVEGELAAVYGPVALISHPHGTSLIRLDALDDAGLAAVSAHLAKVNPTPVPWMTSTSPVAKAVRNRLVSWDGSKLTPWSPGSRPEPEFYLVYFSAHWCVPCRKFTPSLVEAYHDLKKDPVLADRFELIFVSNDRDASEQLKYVREAGMPWPAVAYSQLKKLPVLERWAGRGIPCLVVLNREGQLIYHSFQGETYLGPEHALTRIRQLLPLLDPSVAATRLSRHPLAVYEHIRSKNTGELPAKPYFWQLNVTFYRKLDTKMFEALVQIDTQGRVISVETEPRLPAVHAAQFEREAMEWRFLPRVVDGQAAPTLARIPIEL
jgi:thiol-disulfide isomerase/thioredoxin